MRYFTAVAALALIVGCGQPGPYNPVSPTPAPTPAPAPPPAPDTRPPFSVSISGSSSAFPGQWNGAIAIIATQGMINPEAPRTVRLACGGSTTSRDIGFGSLPIACTFDTPGAYNVQATVTGANGFSALAALGVSVVNPPAVTVTMSYEVILSYSDGRTDVAFSTANIREADRYVWDFGDGDDAETLLPGVRHTYCCDNAERRARVRLIAADGRIIAAGSVVGRW